MRTKEELLEFDKGVKKVIGRAKAGKGVMEIMALGYKKKELRDVQRALARLIEAGEVEREGSKRYSRYVLC